VKNPPAGPIGANESSRAGPSRQYLRANGQPDLCVQSFTDGRSAGAPIIDVAEAPPAFDVSAAERIHPGLAFVELVC
jgi:hypothetical protein